MATLHLDPGSALPGGALGSQESMVRRSLFPAVRWGAVIAGVAVGMSLQIVLTLLGIATGLSATNVATGEMPGMGALIWAGLSILIAAVVGAYVAARMCGLKRKADGVLHGVVSWAVATLLFVMFASSAGGTLLSGFMGSVSQGMSATSTAGRSGGLSGLISRQLGIEVSASDVQALQEHIAAGRRDQAISLMRNKLGIQSERASTIVDQALILSGSPEQASAEGRAAAERAVAQASVVAWSVFGAVALSLVLSAIGGVLGALGARRTSWNEGAASTPATTSAM